MYLLVLGSFDPACNDTVVVLSQAVVQTNIVEIKQIPERTIIHPFSAQEERVTEQEVKSR